MNGWEERERRIGQSIPDDIAPMKHDLVCKDMEFSSFIERTLSIERIHSQHSSSMNNAIFLGIGFIREFIIEQQPSGMNQTH